MSQNIERLVKRSLPIPLTEKELVEFGHRASEIHSRLAHTRFEAKQSSDSFKDRIGGLQDDLSDVMSKIREKKEYREVDCIEVKDFDNKIVNYIYQDEIVESHPLKDEERQITIF